MNTAKELMGEVIAKLNAAGYSGGFYHYKSGECSCCFGRMDKDFFEVNENIPGNWGIAGTDSFYYKISYRTQRKEVATAFRQAANKLCKKYFGKMTQTAKDNFSAIIVRIK